MGGPEVEFVSIDEIFPGYSQWREQNYGTLDQPKRDKDGLDLAARLFRDSMALARIERDNIQSKEEINAVYAEITKIVQEAVKRMLLS